MKPKTEEELEAERIAEEEKANQKALELENNGGTQRSNFSKRSKLIHNPDDPMNILDGQIEEEDREESDGNIKVGEVVEEENKQ